MTCVIELLHQTMIVDMYLRPPACKLLTTTYNFSLLFNHPSFRDYSRLGQVPTKENHWELLKQDFTGWMPFVSPNCVKTLNDALETPKFDKNSQTDLKVHSGEREFTTNDG